MGLTVSSNFQNPAFYQNFLLNGAFDFWQAGTSATVTAVGGGTPTNSKLYQADQWVVNNLLGGGSVEGVITYSQVTGVTDGSIFGASYKITTAPTGTGIGGSNTMWVMQPLSNVASMNLYNKTISCSILVKGLGNANQVNIGLYYATSETVNSASLVNLANTNVTVNSSTFTTATLNNVPVGTSITRSGIIVIVIKLTGASSGNFYDLNNGFVLEQGNLNVGPLALPFQRAYADPASELAACMYFYEVWQCAGLSGVPVATGLVSVANTTAVFYYAMHVKKRSNCAVTVSAASDFKVATAAANAAATAFSDGGSGEDVVALSFTLSGTYTANTSCVCFAANANAKIFMNSRI